MTSYKLWYTEPASTFTEALPFGNGSFGGMSYGQIPEEKITLNDDTLWSGCRTREAHGIDKEVLDQVRRLIFSEKYEEAEEQVKNHLLGFFNESYMPMGTLKYYYENIDDINAYERSLDLNEGIISTSFISNKTKIRSALFASYPDQLIILKIKADGAQKLNITFDFDSLLYHEKQIEQDKLLLIGEAPTHVEPIYVETKEPIIYDEKDKGIQFVTSLLIKNTDGIFYEDHGKLKVSDASYIVVEVATANGFRGYNQELCLDREVIKEACFNKFKKVENQSYKQLLEKHCDDYTNLFNRMDFTLFGNNNNKLTTDQRLSRIKNGLEDLEMFPLYFQFGRYLMIASSRKGTQPSNLQGIWNEEIRPAWSSNYTVNINTQMNYWMANGANLSECAEPLIDMVQELSEEGKQVARNQFHCRGWVTNHNVDLWRQTSPVGGNPKFAYWPMGGCWLTANIFTHYQYTQDDKYLMEKAYPIIKGSTLFCVDWLVDGPDGRVHTCPSTTAENVFLSPKGNICSVSYSSTMDIAIIKELFYNFLYISEKFSIDKDLADTVREKLSRMPNFQVGEDECLQEWIKPFKEVEKGHRHFSPLYALHPANLINKYDTPELLKPCSNLLEKRLANGGGHTGWSCAWLISLYSRLGNAQKAYQYLTHLLKHSTYSNLFDLHPPLGEGFNGEKEVFQIDGNFGGVEGMLAMLVQAHLGEIHILPALPIEWEKGKISGILVQGGYEISMEWMKHKLIHAKIKAKVDNVLRIKYEHEIKVSKNGVIIDTEIDERYNRVILAKSGDEYDIEIYE